MRQHEIIHNQKPSFKDVTAKMHAASNIHKPEVHDD